MSDWNAQVIEEFRANEGKVAQFGDAPLVILNTIGAKSGEVREIPLVALVEGDDVFVFASKGGASTNPDWFYNLKANPEVSVEFGAETFEATAIQLPEKMGQDTLQRQAELLPQFGEYVASAAPRIIPVFSVQRT